MIFQVEWTTYDSAIIHHFEAPEGTTFEQFQSLCDKLMHEAMEEAIEGKAGRSPLHSSPPNLLGYMYGIEEIVVRLPDHGYKEVRFDTVNYTHGMIIDGQQPDKERCEDDFGSGNRLNPELRDKVAEHNRKLTQDVREKRLRQKMLGAETNLTGE